MKGPLALESLYAPKPCWSLRHNWNLIMNQQYDAKQKKAMAESILHVLISIYRTGIIIRTCFYIRKCSPSYGPNTEKGFEG